MANQEQADQAIAGLGSVGQNPGEPQRRLASSDDESAPLVEPASSHPPQHADDDELLPEEKKKRGRKVVAKKDATDRGHLQREKESTGRHDRDSESLQVREQDRRRAPGAVEQIHAAAAQRNDPHGEARAQEHDVVRADDLIRRPRLCRNTAEQRKMIVENPQEEREAERKEDAEHVQRERDSAEHFRSLTKHHSLLRVPGQILTGPSLSGCLEGANDSLDSSD